MLVCIGEPGLGILLAGLHLLHLQGLALTRHLHNRWEAIQHDPDPVADGVDGAIVAHRLGGSSAFVEQTSEIGQIGVGPLGRIPTEGLPAGAVLAPQGRSKRLVGGAPATSIDERLDPAHLRPHPIRGEHIASS